MWNEELFEANGYLVYKWVYVDRHGRMLSDYSMTIPDPSTFWNVIEVDGVTMFVNKEDDV